MDKLKGGKEMSEFKIGDRVEVVPDPKFIELTKYKPIVGMTGIVKDLHDTCAGIEFDDYIGGHSGSWKGKNGYCWYIPYERLEKVEDTEEETKEEVKEEIKADTKAETKSETMEQKILEVLREEIGVDIGEEFDVYENGEKQWTCKFDEVGFSHEIDDEFRESGLWKQIVCKFHSYQFKKKPFVPKYGKDYFFLAIDYDENKNVFFGVLQSTWVDNSIDYGMLALGNVFRNEGEALKSRNEMLERLEKLRNGE